MLETEPKVMIHHQRSNNQSRMRPDRNGLCTDARMAIRLHQKDLP